MGFESERVYEALSRVCVYDLSRVVSGKPKDTRSSAL